MRSTLQQRRACGRYAAALALGSALALAACDTPGRVSAGGSDSVDAVLLGSARAIFKPLPSTFATREAPVTPARVALGRALFFDPRMSLDGTVSCSRCHLPALYGTDGLPLPIGVQSRVNPRNAPTVLNAALQFAEHWRGDRTNVEDQATKALLGPASFGQPSYPAAIARLRATGYGAMFRAAFPTDSNPVTAENWGKAIGAYERTLATPSPFDGFLEGNATALGASAKLGLRKFIASGCSGCHNGVGIGGGMYQKFGLVKDYWTATGSSHIDKGRFDVTKNPADLYVFKVPSLRNVAMTPPYFHDGSVAALPAAVRVMGQVQLGRDLSADDVDAIVAFLESLTGPLPEQFDQVPILPAGGFASARPANP